MMQLQSPTYTKGITESTILVGEPAIHGNPDMSVLQMEWLPQSVLCTIQLLSYVGLGAES
jgi:hypothetical protein